MGLTPPYAFNYHRNKSDRAFHGLAFANFNAPHEAQAAVDTLNDFELEGRRLRVELKKRLPAEEEQRQRLARQSRRQLTQPSPIAPPVNVFGRTTPVPLEQQAQQLEASLESDILDPQLRPRIVFREAKTPTPEAGAFHFLVMADVELDMNDVETLGFYTHMQLFRNTPETQGATLQFPPTLTPQQRNIVHTLAAKLNLDHTSHGSGSERYILVSRRSSPRPELRPQVSSPEIPGYRPFPLEQELLPSTPTPRLRSVASMGNLRSQRSRDQVPPMPSLRYDIFSQGYEHFDPFAAPPRLAHRTSQESASSGSRFHPTRQPIGPPQDQSRGFTERPSREFNIRPIGSGAKPSGSSHGSGSRESRGGSDIMQELHIPHH